MFFDVIPVGDIQYNISGMAGSFLKSYLSNWSQQVSINGVPQWTVFGPLLFTVYMNDSRKLSLRSTIVSFDDDTAILCKGEAWNSFKKVSECDKMVVKTWYQSYLLTLNVNKTKYLPFSSYDSGLPELGPLLIDQDTAIPEAAAIKYLGVIVERHFRWDLHISNVTNELQELLTRHKYLREFLEIS